MKLLLLIVTACIFLAFYNAFLHFVIVIHQCNWPELAADNEDFSIPTTNNNLIKIMVIADIHLRCTEPTWYEYPNENYQMLISYKMAVDRLDPDLIFILGDIMDKGTYCSHDEFQRTLHRFNKIFSIKNDSKLFVIPGNHDIGFHHNIHRNRYEDFEKIFNSPPVQFFSLKKNYFLLINSMTMQDDGCDVCALAESKLTEIEEMLKCSEEPNRGLCADNMTLPIYSRPILLQHVPLYRPHDVHCNDYDSAPLTEQLKYGREYWDHLKEDISAKILRRFKPRLVLSGHMHHGCTRKLPDRITEITISSFNWRKKNNPTIGLGVLTTTNYAFVKCPIPKLSTVTYVYLCGFICIMWLIYWYHFNEYRKRFIIRHK